MNQAARGGARGACLPPFIVVSSGRRTLPAIDDEHSEDDPHPDGIRIDGGRDGFRRLRLGQVARSNFRTGVKDRKWSVRGIGYVEERAASGTQEQIKLVSVTHH
jgi:hypothetical protein